MVNGIAYQDGDNVVLETDDVRFSMTRKDYDYVKGVLRSGVPLEDLNPVIRPSDIIGYLEESNPEAENNVVETEVTIAKRSVSKEDIRILAIGTTIFLALIGLAAFYIIVSHDSGSGASAAATAANTAVSVT
nr:hypothetical protein [uncultured Methanolobus sp.]